MMKTEHVSNHVPPASQSGLLVGPAIQLETTGQGGAVMSVYVPILYTRTIAQLGAWLIAIAVAGGFALAGIAASVGCVRVIWLLWDVAKITIPVI